MPSLTGLALTLLSSSPAQAQSTPTLRTDGIYRSEVQTNDDNVRYISILRFAATGAVYFSHVTMPATQEKVCTWFQAGMEQPHWGKATGYDLKGAQLRFQTRSPQSVTAFEGAVDAQVLRMQLVVPTRQNLTYSLTFTFEPCP
ncbi:MAG: hypothetical protein KAX68_02985 [Giesbergeria sp.]|jgi:hypothetical protein|nr:hypothetical protein [Giesbergeria sp.]